MPVWLKSALAGLAFALAGAGQCLAGLEVKVADNVFVVPDPKAKVITLWMIVRAGCRDEEGGRCRGLAHYLEHLMFLGRPADREGGAVPAFAAGQTNAFTTYQITSYYQSTPVREGAVAGDLDRLFSLFARRLVAVEAAEDAAKREVNVVLQEYNFRRSGGLRAKFHNDMNARLQPLHPISQPTIGSRADIDAFSLDRARAFHQRWYAKNNVTFVAYGPIGAADVKPLVEKYFDPVPPRKVPDRRWLDALRTFEPMDDTLRASDPDTKREEVLFEKIVRFEEADPALSGASFAILADYLNSQMDGGLHDIFVEQKRLATSIGVSTTPIGEGAIWYSVSASPEDGVAPDALKAPIIEYFQDVAKRGVPASVVERLRRRRVASMAEIDKEPQKALSAFTSWLSAQRNHEEWLARGATLAAVSPATIQPLLDAMVSPGRQIFGILSPAK